MISILRDVGCREVGRHLAVGCARPCDVRGKREESEDVVRGVWKSVRNGVKKYREGCRDLARSRVA